MQTPDSHSVADKTGETSAQGIWHWGRERPSLPVAGVSEKRTVWAPPRGVARLTIPQRHLSMEGRCLMARKRGNHVSRLFVPQAAPARTLPQALDLGPLGCLHRSILQRRKPAFPYWFNSLPSPLPDHSLRPPTLP